MQIEVIRPDALIDIQVSAYFLSRLQELLTWMITNEDTDTVKKANENISQNKELNEWEEHYSTLLSLIADLEEAARIQNKITTIDINDSEPNQ